MDPLESPLTAVSDTPPGLDRSGTVVTPVVANPNNPPWGVPGALTIWLSSIALLAIIPIFTALPYVILSQLPLTDALQKDKDFIFYSVLGMFPAHFLTLLIAWLIATRVGRYQFWRTLGWHWKNFGPWKSIFTAVFLLALGTVVTYYFGGPKTELEELISSSYRTRLTVAILAATTAPLVEEVVYRGLLYAALQRVIGVAGSIALVTIMFAAVHFWQYWPNFWVIAVICLLSLTLTVVRAYSGSLLQPYVIHLVFNGIQSVFLVVQPLFDKTEQSPEAMPALILAALKYFH